MTMRATWQGAVLAESDETIEVDGYHYFPPTTVRDTRLTPSSTTTICFWKGQASYFNIEVGAASLPDGAWVYPEVTTDEARPFEGWIAFYTRKGIKVESV